MKKSISGLTMPMSNAISAVDLPSSPMKPKPTLHVDLEEIDGVGNLNVGDTVTLTVTGKVTGMNKDEMGNEQKDMRTAVTLRLSKITQSHGSADESETPAEDAGANEESE